MSTILKLPNGIPSHDTINRVFSLIKPDKFEQLFAQWVQSLIDTKIPGEVNGKKTSEERLYISSVESDAKNFNLFIRQHWGVENSLHWTLDVTFREDAQRKRNGYAASNFALVEKIALNLLKSEGSKNMSIKSKRLVAAWDNEFLLEVLRI